MKVRTRGAAFLAAFLLACGGGGGEVGPPLDPDACPVPGQGITIGGVGGSGDTAATPVRRVVLMGGGREDDGASTLFVEGAGGGDILVLRATGSTTSYPTYFTETLAPSPAPASAVTVRTDNPSAGGDTAVLCRLGRAEAVWLAGGNQWDYLGGWPAALHEGLAQLTTRGGVVGGTSAGAVSLGEAAFDAREGTVTSAEALADPLTSGVSLSYPAFALPELHGMLVDSHFAERDREGRLLAFLARFLREKGRGQVVGIGLDEGAALVLEAGEFRVFGPRTAGVRLYRATGPATLIPSTPLGLEGVRRVRLGPGDRGVWPPDFDDLAGEDVRVRFGVVEEG